MDLTPPSLTTSPFSPQRKSTDSPPPYAYCLPEVSSVNYAALTSIDNLPYNVPPPYGSLIDPLLSNQGVDGSTNMTTLDSMASAGNLYGHSVAGAGSPEGSTASTMPHVLSSTEYDQFTTYEQPCLPPSSYAATVGPYGRPTPQHSPAFVHTSPPSTADISGREQTAYPPSQRGSFSFPTEQTVTKQDVAAAIQYGPLDQEANFTPPSRSLHPRLPPGYLQELQHPQPQLHAGAFPAQLTTQQPAQLSLSRTKQDPKLRPGDHRYVRQRVVKPKRHIRKHTTQEEANFQCKVKGCGKYFSRSYNFKSHMETHDEKREYPFPCNEPNCTKKFVRKTDLQRHHQSVHTKERNHKCDYCGRLFARKDTLRRHMEDGCSKRFEIGMLDTEEYPLNLALHKLPPSAKANEVMMGVTLPPPMLGARAMPGIDSWR